MLISIIPVVHGHERGERLGTCLVVKPCVSCVVSLQHVSMFHYVITVLREVSNFRGHTQVPLYSAVNLGHLERAPTAPNVNHIHLFDFKDNKKNCRLLLHKLSDRLIHLD